MLIGVEIMKIIELNEVQFKNYSKLHSSRNYFQTCEYAKINSNYNRFPSLTVL